MKEEIVNAVQHIPLDFLEFNVYKVNICECLFLS